jgi:hypothetical protein
LADDSGGSDVRADDEDEVAAAGKAGGKKNPERALLAFDAEKVVDTSSLAARCDLGRGAELRVIEPSVTDEHVGSWHRPTLDQAAPVEGKPNSCATRGAPGLSSDENCDSSSGLMPSTASAFGAASLRSMIASHLLSGEAHSAEHQARRSARGWPRSRRS